MNVKINGKDISISISTYFEGILAEYHKYNDELTAGFKAANKRYLDDVAEGMYTSEEMAKRLTQAREKAMATFNEKASALNEKWFNYLADIQHGTHRALSEFTKPDDYELKINNALQFLKIEGKGITDEAAHDVLKEFENDMSTMRTFKRVIEKQKGTILSDAYGNTTFPLTFKRFENLETYFGHLTELIKNSKLLFTMEKSETQTEITKTGQKLYLPMDCYMQLISEKNIIEDSKKFEEMSSELFETV